MSSTTSTNAPIILGYHTCRCPVVTDEWNAQTLEGGFFVWDGATTRLDYGIAFQWDLNPWSDFGAIRIWTANGGAGQWAAAGHLVPDTNGHHVEMTVGASSQTAALTIDDTQYPVELSKTSKPDSMGHGSGGPIAGGDCQHIPRTFGDKSST